MKIPNLELRAGLIPLLLSLEPIKEPWEAWQKACHMVSSLIKLEAEGFENAFRNFLAQFPDSSQTPGDAHYQSLFQMAMLLAEAKLEMEISAANREARLWAPDGTQFVIEIKYCPDRSLEAQKKVIGPLKDRRPKMSALAKEVIKQLDDKIYTRDYWGEDHDLYRVALVVGGRTEVLVELKKEKRN
ncbi:MAG: hypothetical protein LBT47_13065 [Deltaproteobacteria bacterium]|nr:hypothetical protein [Deltaproteobacteria bacterium]